MQRLEHMHQVLRVAEGELRDGLEQPALDHHEGAQREEAERRELGPDVLEHHLVVGEGLLEPLAELLEERHPHQEEEDEHRPLQPANVAVHVDVLHVVAHIPPLQALGRVRRVGDVRMGFVRAVDHRLGVRLDVAASAVLAVLRRARRRPPLPVDTVHGKDMVSKRTVVSSATAVRCRK